MGTGATLNLADQINGGSGIDTLKIYSDNAVTLPAGLSNVEKIYISDNIHQSYDVSTSALSAVTSLELANGVTVDGAVMTLTGKTGLELALTDLADADTATDAGDGDVAVAAAASVTSQSLNLTRVGAQAAATLLSATNDVDFDITGTGVATLNVAATGMNNISLANTGAALTTLNVSGDGTLAVQGTTATTITTFSAASNSGGVTVDLSASAGANQTITGGSGADTITVDLARNITLNTGAGNDVVTLANPTAANLSSTTGAADSINGGDGTDTLVLTAAGADALDSDVAADRAVISGFERVRISNDLNAVTVNAANISGGVNYVQLGADTTTANGTIAGVTSGATIENRANAHAGSTVTIAAAGVGDWAANDTVSATIRGTTVTYTVIAGDLTGTDAADLAAVAAGLTTAINTQFGAGTASSAAGVITLTTTVATAVAEGAVDADISISTAAGDAIETDITMTGATAAGTPDDLLNISLNGNITNNDNVESGYGVSGINKLVFTTADRDNSDGTTDRNDGYIVNLTNDNAVSLITVNGDRAFAFASTASTGALATFNAGGMTGDLSLNLATNGLTQGVVVTGGAGTNTITATGFADNITGGSRADTITSGNGADVVTGGAGADIFIIGAGSSGGTPSSSVFETITDFAKASDVIRGAQTFTVEQSATASTGVAAINAEGIATFNSADDTLAERIVAVEAGITAGTESAGDFAIFELDGNSYVFIHDGTAGLAATDVLIKLTGVTSLSDSTISTTDLTIA